MKNQITNYIRHILLAIFALTIGSVASAYPAPQYNFRHIDSSKGLSANNVKSIVHDKLGFMWFGTKNGLNRYDGSTLRVYQCYDEEKGCGNNNIGALYEDENSILWIGTDRGVYQYNPHEDRISFVSISTAEGVMPNNWVQNIVGDGRGSVWVLLPDQGVFLYKDGKVKHFAFADNAQFKKVYPNDICVTKDGTVWVIISGGTIYKYKADSGNFVKAKIADASVITDRDFATVCESTIGNLIIGTLGGVIYEYEPATGVIKNIPYSGSGKVYLRDIQCFDDELWIGAQNGMYVVNLMNHQENFITENPLDQFSLSDNTVYYIYRDNNGGAWVGTIFGGVSYMPRRKFAFTNFGLKDGMTGRLVLGVNADRHDHVWIGTETAGVNVLDPALGRVTMPSYFSHPDKIVLSMDSFDGNIYSSFSRIGLFRINPENGTVTKVFPLKNEIDNNVYSYLIDSEGNEWVGLSFALYRRKKGEADFEHITEVGYDWVYCIYEASDGTIWIGTMGNGIWKYNKSNGAFKLYVYDQNSDTPSGLRSNSINSIMEDSEGRVWFSTDRGGLSRYDKATDKFVTYGIEEGLPDDVVYSVVEDHGKNLWFGTNKGLVRFTPSDSKIRVFTQSDGLPFEQFNYKSATSTTDGMVYMGGINGIVAFKPDDYTEMSTSLPIYFTGLNVLNEEVRPGKDSFLKENILFADKLELNHEASNFTLSIASPEFRHLGKILFSYRLLPGNGEWIKMNDNDISFANLAPGKYTLEIKAECESTTATRQLEIKILPPWWQSTWAYGIYLLLIIILATLWFLWYRNRKEKQLRVHEQSLMAIKDKELYRSKVSFFTEIAHEIRTPLSLIDLPLEAMEELKIDDPQFKKYLAVTRKNTKRLLTLTGQLLDFEKIDSSRLTLKNENVDIPALLNDTADRFETPMKLAGKTLVREIDPSPLVVMADREALIKTISNLLNNARKYGCSLVRLSLTRNDNNFVIKVASDGTKIKVEDRERIFNVFYQTDTAEELKNGVGIGLPLSRSLATLMGGSLMLEDNPDEPYNTFTLTLPVIEPEDKTHAPDPEIDAYMLVAESNQAKPRSDVFNILLVEDNENILNFLAEQLSRSFVVTTAHNGVDALEKIKANQPDLILTDIMMPEMDGMELCNAVKSDMSLSHIPLVFITAKNDLESKIQGLQNGAEAFVEKPFSIKYLRQLISSILDNRRREREAFAKNPFYSSENAQVGEADREFMEKVRVLIEENISDENFSVDSLCDKLNMSRSALLRKIKSLFGLSPIEVIRTIKLKKAAELIQDGRYRISDVCYMVGIATPSYFSKLFFKQFGMTPKDFEKQCRSKGNNDEA